MAHDDGHTVNFKIKPKMEIFSQSKNISIEETDKNDRNLLRECKKLELFHRLMMRNLVKFLTHPGSINDPTLTTT